MVFAFFDENEKRTYDDFIRLLNRYKGKKIFKEEQEEVKKMFLMQYIPIIISDAISYKRITWISIAIC